LVNRNCWRSANSIGGISALASDFSDAVEIRRDLGPAPQMGERLQLRRTDPAGGEPAACLDSGIAEPRALRRRVRLGA
jgi:hypothetical protein